MPEYFILGVPHDIQDSHPFEREVRNEIQNRQITLVAEEFPFDEAIISTARSAARSLQIPYLQIDLVPNEWSQYGIDCEMRARSDAACFQGQDVRLTHADGIRENLWISRIEESPAGGRVLVICGYLHVKFLADNIHRRNGTVLAEKTFPACLLERQPEKTFSPNELREHLGLNGGFKAPRGT
jgi:hypothetical protein